MPPTYPVKGKVVFKGGKALPYARVEFQSLADAAVTATGQADKDGTFVLTTHEEGRKAPAAVEGKHKVVVEQGGYDTRLIVTVLPAPVTVEPKDNELLIKIPPPRR